MKKKILTFVALVFCILDTMATSYTWNNTSGAHDFPDETITGTNSVSYTFTSRDGTEFTLGGELGWNSKVTIVLDGNTISTQNGESEYGSAGTIFSYRKTFSDEATHIVMLYFSDKSTGYNLSSTTSHIYHAAVKHPVENQTRVRTITLDNAGDLQYHISDTEKYYITKLTISGPVNGTDMRIIHEMAGSSVLNTPTSGVLSVLDMRNAIMTSGGGICGVYHDTYYGSYGDYDETDYVTMASGIINTGLFYSLPSLTSIVLPNSVTEIRKFAFQGCNNLTTITIPASVTSIGEKAFSGCNSLTKPITEDLAAWCAIDFFDESSNPICYANTLYTSSTYAPKSLTIPAECKKVEKYAFYNNKNITSVTFPEGMESIGIGAFWGCTNLTSVIANGGLGVVQGNAFSGCTKISSVNTNNLAEWCKSSFSINIEEYIVKDSQGNYAHGNDDEDGWYYIEAYRVTGSSNPTTFSKNLKVNGILVSNVSIPEGTNKIGSAAFYNCSNIKSISIPTSIKSIGKMAFEGCSYLTTCYIPDISSWNDIQFETFCLYRANCTLSVDVVIGGQTYYNATYSEQYYYSSNPSLLSGNLYCNGSLITNATFNTSVTTINLPFEYCKKQIVSVSIPNSITSINNNAFNGCSNLSIVRIDIAVPLSIASTTFSNRTNATLYVPYGSKAAYEAADYWKEFKEIIEFVDGDVNGDGESDVVDVVDIARYVVGTPAETFVPILADVNNSGEVNIADAVCLVNEIAGDQNFAKSMMVPRKAETIIDALSLTEGENGLSLVLENQRDYTAFQFDLYVPEDVDVMQMMLNKQRKQKHQLLYNKVEDGHWRVAALSTSNRTFEGNNGELLSFTLDGISNEGVTLSNILFFDAEGNGYQFEDITLNGTTMIQSMDNGQCTMDNSSTVYDLQGRKMVNGNLSNRQLPRGVYIVNGKKVVIK